MKVIDFNKIASFITDILPLIFSIISIFIARKSWLVAQGEIEFQIANTIREAQYRVSDSALEIAKYKNEFIEKNSSESSNLESIEELLNEDLVFITLEQKFEQSVEIMLNSYEESCAKYLDKKIDAKRFKRSYHSAIRKIVEDESTKGEFNTTTSSYKCILKVYNQWYNLEQ